MIEFKVRELPVEQSFPFPQAKQLYNAAANGLAKVLQERHGEHCCQFHPDFENVFTIVPNESGNMTLEYTKVCCEHFAGMISFAEQ